MSVDPVIPPQQTAPNAVLALVVGIVGILVCPLLGPIAWVLGANAEKAVDASGGRLGGRGLGTAGKILGIIGTVLFVLGIGLLLLLMAGS